MSDKDRERKKRIYEKILLQRKNLLNDLIDRVEKLENVSLIK